LAVLRFRGFPAYCATLCHVGLPVANDPSLPHHEGRLCSTAKLPCLRPGRVKTRIRPVRAYVSFHRLRTYRRMRTLPTVPRDGETHQMISIIDATSTGHWSKKAW